VGSKVRIGAAEPGAFWMARVGSQTKTSAISRGFQRLALVQVGDAQSMKQDEWKSLLLLEWDRWLKTQPIDPLAPTARDTLKFFCELQDKQSPLLDFRTGRREQWPIIHARLLNEGRVLD